MSGPNRKVVLAFMAHPDDAELLCAGTLIRLADAGWEAHIATLSAGDCGSTTLGSEEIMAARREEAAESAALIGATYHCLDERDALIVYDKPTCRKAIDLFRAVAPALVLTHAPADYMVDHEVTCRLARSASFIYSAPNASELPLIDGSAVPHLYYCDPLEGIDPLGREVPPTTLVDITDQLERKNAMLACHASQREWLRAHHGTDEYIDAMARHAARRGALAGCEAAEGFVHVRCHAYPANDLLAELLAPGRRT